MSVPSVPMTPLGRIKCSMRLKLDAKYLKMSHDTILERNMAVEKRRAKSYAGSRFPYQGQRGDGCQRVIK